MRPLLDCECHKGFGRKSNDEEYFFLEILTDEDSLIVGSSLFSVLDVTYFTKVGFRPGADPELDFGGP